MRVLLALLVVSYLIYVAEGRDCGDGCSRPSDDGVSAILKNPKDCYKVSEQGSNMYLCDYCISVLIFLQYLCVTSPELD